MEEGSKKGYGYGGKPWWFWALVYVVIGAVVYYAIYYFVYAKKGYSYPSGTTNQQQQKSPYGY